MSTTENAREILANKIVEAIMPSQNEPRPITRIQLLSGKWPGQERGEGGFNREALKRTILKVLEK